MKLKSMIKSVNLSTPTIWYGQVMMCDLSTIHGYVLVFFSHITIFFVVLIGRIWCNMEIGSFFHTYSEFVRRSFLPEHDSFILWSFLIYHFYVSGRVTFLKCYFPFMLAILHVLTCHPVVTWSLRVV